MKNQIRTEIRQKRDDFDKSERAKLDEIIYNKLISTEAVQKAKTIMTYISMGSEADTYRFIDYCFNNNKKVSVPVTVKGEREMKISYIDSMDDLERGAYEIMQPVVFKKCDISDIDVVIVPGVAFDKNNHRIGYGGGYYDRLLSNYNGVTIGLCYDFCIVDSTEPEGHDVAVDILIRNSESQIRNY